MLATSAQSGQDLCVSLRKSENTNSMKFCKDYKHFEPVEDKRYKSWFNRAEQDNLPKDFFTDWEHSKCGNSKTVTKDTYYTVNWPLVFVEMISSHVEKVQGIMKSCDTCKYLKRYTWWKFWQTPRMCTFFDPPLYRSTSETYEQYCGPKKTYWIRK